VLLMACKMVRVQECLETVRPLVCTGYGPMMDCKTIRVQQVPGNGPPLQGCDMIYSVNR
jgi:hypothetical protein